MTGVEAGGEGLDSGKHGASIERGQRGVLHGSMSYILQDAYGQIIGPIPSRRGSIIPASAGAFLAARRGQGPLRFRD